MKKFIYLLLLFPFLLQANATTDSINTLDNDSAKYAYRHLVAAPVPPDSADAARLERKAFWRASAETAGFNNKQRLSISLANRFYRLYTWKGYDTYSF